DAEDKGGEDGDNDDNDQVLCCIKKDLTGVQELEATSKSYTINELFEERLKPPSLRAWTVKIIEENGLKARPKRLRQEPPIHDQDGRDGDEEDQIGLAEGSDVSSESIDSDEESIDSDEESIQSDISELAREAKEFGEPDIAETSDGELEYTLKNVLVFGQDQDGGAMELKADIWERIKTFLEDVST
ncbi:MAG: hypothetical protein Q9164_007783, partial [Protoblastenia rupestris]